MPDLLAHLVSPYAYLIVAALICIESFGVPVPGETSLIIASVYAATSGALDIWILVPAAIAGAVVGDNIGFWIGERYGYRLALRFGHYVGLTEARIKLGQYLFLRHGRRIVFIGRFVPVLRELTAFIAGVNQMAWKPFLLANASGATVWASFYGFGAYLLGVGAQDAAQSVEIGIAVGVSALFGIVSLYVFRHEEALEAEAERALPGPLRSTRPDPTS
jgi:membrane protein DedA with SNARE-associated domain